MSIANPSSHISLGHLPDGPWQFDEGVTACFTDMLVRSIPQLDIMRQLTFGLGCRFVHPGDHILDLGCALGDALAPFITKYGAYCQYTGLELSQPMYDAAQRRFAACMVSDAYGASASVPVSILQCDLRTDYPQGPFALTLSILTLMFIPLEQRQRIMARLYAQTQPGGACILVEKILGETASLDDLFVEQYYLFKKRSGYTTEEIERKRLALEGVLVPMTARWNEDILRQAGFTVVDCFWRWGNFAGWIAIKG
jgi:tRNA (cmo5U34)-methyltransferase